jgi:hypothetical protein
LTIDRPPEAVGFPQGGPLQIGFPQGGPLQAGSTKNAQGPPFLKDEPENKLSN